MYSLDERFNLDRSTYQYGTCFKMEDMCAEQFLETHVNGQLFNLEDTTKNVTDTDHPRLAFQTFGTDFAFQDAPSSWRNAETVLANLERYLKGNFKFEFMTFSQLHARHHGHHDFDKVLPGDMFVYTEFNKDSWSGYYGSKPDLKYHIKRVFNSFRATESLIFTVRAALETMRLLKIESELLALNFQQKLI